MATEAQIQTMLDLMRSQMEQLTTLHTENAHLRNISQGPTVKTKTPDCPIVNANIDEREWELFKDSWQRYKTMTGLINADSIRMELRAACSPDVNKLLFEFIGSTTLDTTTEQDLLEHIRSTAVKTTHKEVHRINFSKLMQAEGEAITQFVARLKSQASLCQFNITCPSHNPPVLISYADDMVTQQLMAGLRNPDHQSRVLAESTTLTTLNQKIERLQCLEATEDSTSLMRTTPATTSTASVEAMFQKSQYQRRKKTFNQRQPKPTPPKFPSRNKCRGCGNSTHPEGKSMSRRDCPAYNKVCGSCGIIVHFRAVCEKSRSNAVEIPEQPELKTQPTEPPLNDTASFSFASQDFRRGQYSNSNG